MMNNNPNAINGTTIDQISNEENVYGAEMLAGLALSASGSRQDALEALLIAAAHITVHADGNLTNNMEIARQKYEALLKHSKEAHAGCIEDLKAQGHQYDEVH